MIVVANGLLHGLCQAAQGAMKCQLAERRHLGFR